MVHDLVLAAKGNRTLGTFEEAREEIVVNVRHQVLDSTEDFAAYGTAITLNTASVEAVQFNMLHKGTPV